MFTKINSKPSHSGHDWRSTALRAEAERRVALAELRCAGDLKRLGVVKGSGQLDPHKLDAVLTEKKIEPRERMRIKSDCSVSAG